MLVLTEKVERQTTEHFLELPFELRQKTRFRGRLSDGRETALLLNRGVILHDGDCLKAESGEIVKIVAAPEMLSHVSGPEVGLLLKAAYHLGNRHVALQVTENWLRYIQDSVLDEMVRGLGLSVESISAPFEPERGAYASQHGH